MQVNPNGDLFAFPMLPEVEGETYEERLERSRREGERQRREMMRRLFGESASSPMTEAVAPTGETVRDAQDRRERRERDRRLGHPRATVDRPATAGKW